MPDAESSANQSPNLAGPGRFGQFRGVERAQFRLGAQGVECYWKTICESRIPVVVNFKEFRTPSLLFWNVYYNTACGYIDKNILD